MASFVAASATTCDSLRSPLPVAASLAALIKLVCASAHIKADITLRARLPNGPISVFVILAGMRRGGNKSGAEPPEPRPPPVGPIEKQRAQEEEKPSRCLILNGNRTHGSAALT